jgi:hypothetical protein
MPAASWRLAVPVLPQPTSVLKGLHDCLAREDDPRMRLMDVFPSAQMHFPAPVGVRDLDLSQPADMFFAIQEVQFRFAPLRPLCPGGWHGNAPTA